MSYTWSVVLFSCWDSFENTIICLPVIGKSDLDFFHFSKSLENIKTSGYFVIFCCWIIESARKVHSRVSRSDWISHMSILWLNMCIYRCWDWCVQISHLGKYNICELLESEASSLLLFIQTIVVHSLQIKVFTTLRDFFLEIHPFCWAQVFLICYSIQKIS